MLRRTLLPMLLFGIVGCQGAPVPGSAVETKTGSPEIHKTAQALFNLCQSHRQPRPIWSSLDGCFTMILDYPCLANLLQQLPQPEELRS
jgi:hypothetical protein